MNTMRQLKSTAEDLRHLYKQNITVRFIAEPLESCDVQDSAKSVRDKMVAKSFDVLGFSDQGRIVGYVNQERLVRGTCQEALCSFQPQELIAESTPLLDVLTLFKTNKRFFVIKGNAVSYIVTQGDLQKAPVRMLLFSLVTLLEMHMLRLVRLYYSDEAWQAKLKVDRLSDAKNIFGQRTGRNEAIDLADCLQFCDKRDLLLEHDTARKDMRLSRKGGEKLLKHAEKLRNNLAHGQDLVAGKDWEEIIELAEQIEKLVVTCESITETTS